MTLSEGASLLALGISTVGLFTSIYVARRDAVRLKVTGKFIPAHPIYGQANIVLTIINHGRRPAILMLVGGNTADGNWAGTYLGKEYKGLRLGENERHEETLYKNDLVQQVPEGFFEYTSLWFEDSLGRRHNVRNSETLIKQLRESSDGNA
jgi:hypothetical protein